MANNSINQLITDENVISLKDHVRATFRSARDLTDKGKGLALIKDSFGAHYDDYLVMYHLKDFHQVIQEAEEYLQKQRRAQQGSKVRAVHSATEYKISLINYFIHTVKTGKSPVWQANSDAFGGYAELSLNDVMSMIDDINAREY